MRLLPVLAPLLGLGPTALAQSNETTRVELVSPTLCLSGGRNTDPTTVAALKCDNAADQRWQIKPTGGTNNAVQIMAPRTNSCLDVEGLSPVSGAKVGQYNCNGGANQQFMLRPQSGGYALVAVHSELCMAAKAPAAAGAALEQQSCDGSAQQTWRLPDLRQAPPQEPSSNAATHGRWAPRLSLPLVPTAASHLPDGRVLLWSAFDRFNFSTEDNGRTYTLLYDPVRGTFSETLVSQTGHDMFCPGIANLPDGRIHVTGGSSAAATSVFDTFTQSWNTATPMLTPRGYQGALTLPNGDVLTLGGSWSGGQGNKPAERWRFPSGPWQAVPGISAQAILTQDAGGAYRSDNHAWLFAGPGGRVFHAGPSRRMHWFDPNGNGATTDAGTRGSDGDAMNGNAVMFDTHRIVTFGGAPSYEDANATKAVHVIDLNQTPVQAKATAPMNYARAFHNSVVLPDGQVMIVGGQTYPKTFTDDRAVLVPELWHPQTESLRPLAPMGLPRTYHSVALLLPDARVLSAGGGLCGGCMVNHPDLQVFSPPYLFNRDGSAAPRPAIVNAPDELPVGSTATVETDTPVREFSLVRLSSTTHTVNNEQRRIPLATSLNGPGLYVVQLPASTDALVPGYYMLFALSPTGVPSVARIVKVNG